MGYLKGKTVYLAGPIHDSIDDGKGWRDMITPRLIDEFGIIVTDPTHKTIYGEVSDDKNLFNKLAAERKFDELRDKFWPVIRKDLRMVDKADFIIALYSPNVKMCGTLHELCISQQERKPTLIYCKDSEAGEINPWILTFAKKGCFFTDWEKIFEYLREVDKGNFDYDYWTL